MEQPELFSSKKEFISVSMVLLFFLFIHLTFKYYAYQNFIAKPFYYIYAEVITSYSKTKHHKTYQVLKLHADEGLIFYTTTHRKESFSHKRLRLQIFPNQSIEFQDYLGTFYVKSKMKQQEKRPQQWKDSLIESVNGQHSNSTLQSFYNAIFFATPIEKDLREKITLLGVSHLVALSGFHLSILWGLVYGLLLLIYTPLQQRYFPYRYARFDVGLAAMGLLAFYVWFVDAPPSLVRAFAMVFIGWSVLLMGLALLRFTFLSIVLLLLLVLFPSLVVSLSFWLSVAGVFYIFLLLRYFGHRNKWVMTLLIIPLGIFVLMLPVVHGIFGLTSLYQLLSVLLSILFAPFYPVVMGLHLLGFGDLFDRQLLWLFALPENGVEHLLPLWVVFGYIGLSIGAIWYRKVFYVLCIIAFLYGGYLFLW